MCGTDRCPGARCTGSAGERWVPETPPESKPFLEQFGYTAEDLTSSLGFDLETAERLLAFAAEDEFLAFAESLPNQWQQNAALGLAVGDSIDGIKTSLGLGSDEFDATVPPADGRPAEATPSVSLEQAEASELLESLKRPASQMQFTFVDDDEELRRVIEGGDFGAWRVFLHPEQRAYATRTYQGPFRLTGGAGTGKTVVLLHRARGLAEDTDARIILTTFTRTLAGMLAETSDGSTPSSLEHRSSARPASSPRGSTSLRTPCGTPRTRPVGNSRRSTPSAGTPNVHLAGLERHGGGKKPCSTQTLTFPASCGRPPSWRASTSRSSCRTL